MFKCPECGTKKHGDHCFHDYGKYRVGYYLGKKRKSTYISTYRWHTFPDGTTGRMEGSPFKMIEGIEKLDETRIDAMFLLQ